MRTITRGLIAATLAFGLGCTSTDWIDRTLVTVDVDGSWRESTTGFFWLDLKQEGTKVTGSLGMLGPTSPPGRGDKVEGTLAGDTFSFKEVSGSMQGEMTVSGDEMSGRVSHHLFGTRQVSLRRTGPPSQPGSPTR